MTLPELVVNPELFAKLSTAILTEENKFFRPIAPASHWDKPNAKYLYTHKYNCQPSVWSSELPLSSIDVLLNKMKTICVTGVLKQYENTTLEINDFYLLEYLDAFVVLDFHGHKKSERENFLDKNVEYSITILYQEKSTLEKIQSDLEFVKDKPASINLINKNQYGQFSLIPCEVNLPKEVDIEANYNGLIEKYDAIKDVCKNSLSGLALFSGEPGTGKSTFLKHLISQVDRKVIYLPSGLTNILSSPELIGFLINNKGGIFIIEDAEEVLMSRDKQATPAIANILNLTDGLLGDCIQTLIIATFNTNKINIDNALLRKGRLLFEHEFTKLSPEKCQNIWKKLGLDESTKEPLTLAEVFHREDTNFHETKEVKRLGF